MKEKKRRVRGLNFKVFESSLLQHADLLDRHAKMMEDEPAGWIRSRKNC
jgi:hypothetical protein